MGPLSDTLLLSSVRWLEKQDRFRQRQDCKRLGQGVPGKQDQWLGEYAGPDEDGQEHDSQLSNDASTWMCISMKCSLSMLWGLTYQERGSERLERHQLELHRQDDQGAVQFRFGDYSHAHRLERSVPGCPLHSPC